MSDTPIADELREKLRERPSDMNAVIEAVAAIEQAAIDREDARAREAKKRRALYER